MYLSQRRLSRRDVSLGERPPRQVLGSHAIRIEDEKLQQAKAFARFIQIHKEGDVVSASVIRSKRKGAEVVLDGGVKASITECCNHEPGKKVRWLLLPNVGQRVQVYVRAICREKHYVSVSVHTFTQDAKFNLFNGGYRSTFDGSKATFALLPWEMVAFSRAERRG
jgi:hypothetical protein